MTYKVGSTTVISSSGYVDWSRISNKPSIPSQGVTEIAAVKSGSGTIGFTATKNSSTKYTLTLTYNCNCACHG